ncbi:hypothetical protein AB0L00_18845 [Actinoallomurus sp. NPDC052308]|uniref:hypothetical protein n=1 Tax=Actinoallomurus sp. NPDC052308 TaxID=3155530 RepID=UPI0034150932
MEKFGGLRVVLITRIPANQVRAVEVSPNQKRARPERHRSYGDDLMCTILATAATAAILALGLSACNNAGGAGAAPAPSSAASSATAATTSSSSSASAGQSTAPQQHNTVAPSEQDAPPSEVGQAEGELTYLAPGKYQVGDTVFFTAADTVLIVAGGKCPDGAARPDNRCTTDNMDMWVQSAQRFAKVSFSGQAATVIREVEDI